MGNHDIKIYIRRWKLNNSVGEIPTWFFGCVLQVREGAFCAAVVRCTAASAAGTGCVRYECDERVRSAAQLQSAA